MNKNAHDSVEPFLRKVRSFVTRAGRTTSAQQKAIEQYGPDFLISFDQCTSQSMWPKQNSATKILEIGFGMGETTAQIAQIRSDDQFLAIEVHEPGVGALLKKIGEMNLTNLRLMQYDAVEVLRNKIEADVLDGVHIFFPDPWHKKRHHKRRLIQEEFVGLLISRLKLGGYIHLATDWQPYAEQMLEVLNARTELLNLSADKTYSPKPAYRPITKFEKRGLGLGHGVWDLMFKKIEVNKIEVNKI